MDRTASNIFADIRNGVREHVPAAQPRNPCAIGHTRGVSGEAGARSAEAIAPCPVRIIGEREIVERVVGRSSGRVACHERDHSDCADRCNLH